MYSPPLRDGHTWTALELAAGWPLGGEVLALPDTSRAPRAIIEESVREALLQRPCVVEFSGGRDSSAILAVAMHVARRDGLEEPVAVTRVYPGSAEADEGAWPEIVVRHLGVREWERIPIHEELDAVGDIALKLVRRFGPLWPPAAHSHVPIFERCRGGAVLTGEGGDTMFGSQRGSPLRRVLARRQRINRAALRALWRSHAPRWLRRRAVFEQQSYSARVSWMTPEAFAAFQELKVAHELEQPLSWAGSIGWQLGARSWRIGYAFLEKLANEHHVALHQPLSTPALAGALVDDAGYLGFKSRADAMLGLFGDLLPEAVLRRTTKASFNASLFGSRSRSFAASWHGVASFTGLVEAEAVRERWLSHAPHPALIPALQAAWMEGESSTGA